MSTTNNDTANPTNTTEPALAATQQAATPAQAAPVVPPTAPPAPSAAAPQVAPGPNAERDPEWLNKRIASAKRSAEASVLKELGFGSVEDAKKASAELQKQRDADKTIAEKAAEIEATYKTTKAERDALYESLAAYATTQLAGLTDVQRAAVEAVAGDDPSKQLAAIRALSPTWASAPVAPDPATSPGAAPVAAPATNLTDTTPAPTAPSDRGASASNPNHRAVYDELMKTNPVVASRYALAHGVFDSQ